MIHVVSSCLFCLGHTVSFDYISWPEYKRDLLHLKTHSVSDEDIKTREIVYKYAQISI